MIFLIIVLVFILIVFFYRLLTGNWIFNSITKKSISLSFEILEPTSERGKSIDLSELLTKKKFIKIGGETNIFKQEGYVMSLNKDIIEGNLAVTINIEKGNVYIKRPGQTSENSVINDQIYDGDILRFGIYRVRICSFDLIK
jgi:predicted membrane metal-binding protein